jgi:hypothetical protein
MKLLISILMAIGFTNGLHADPPAVHGMLLFGNDSSYVSHLPMFHSPHDYQLLAKVQISDFPRAQTSQIYEQAKAEGEKLFTLVPKAMDLTKLIDGSIQEFSGVIYQGHFERGGKALGPIVVKIENLIIAQKLNAQTPPPAEESYLVFGTSGEYFAAHLIGGRPNFDYIVQTELPERLNQLQNPRCTRLNCGPQLWQAINEVELPMVLASKLSKPLVGEILGDVEDVKTVVIEEIYHETGDLEH